MLDHFNHHLDYKCEENNFLFSEDAILFPVFQFGILFIFCSMTFPLNFLRGIKELINKFNKFKSDFLHLSFVLNKRLYYLN